MEKNESNKFLGDAPVGKNESNKFLGDAPVGKLLLRFAVPSILSLLISSLYNIVDQIFIGNSSVGYLGNASTTVSFPFVIITASFAWAFGNGTASYVSIAHGRGDNEHAHKAVGNSLLASAVVSLIAVLVGYLFMEDILYLFGASTQSIGLAKEYLGVILIGIPFFMIGGTMSGIIRADGSPAFSMVASLSGAIINIILDPIFIFVFKWGMAGAGWATIIGQFATFALSLWYFIFRTKSFRLKWSSWKPDWAVFGASVKLGTSTFITQMSIVVVSLVCNIMLVKYGASSKYGQDIPLAVIGIVMKVFTIVISFTVGVSVGAQPILGYNMGAKNYKRVREVFRLVMITTIVAGVIATLVFEFFPSVVIRLFGSESELYNEFAKKTFRIFLSLVIFTCVTKVISIFFQAVGHPTESALLSLTRDIICGVPLIILLPLSMGIDGILWSGPIADIVSVTLSVILISIFFRKLKKHEQKV